MSTPQVLPSSPRAKVALALAMVGGWFFASALAGTTQIETPISKHYGLSPSGLLITRSATSAPTQATATVE